MDPATARAMTYPRGLYDLVITEAVVRALDSSHDHAETQPLVGEDASDRLLGVLREQLRRVLDDTSSETDGDRVRLQLQLVNDLLHHVRETRPGGAELIDALAEPAHILRAIRHSHEPAPESPATVWPDPGSSRPAGARRR